MQPFYSSLISQQAQGGATPPYLHTPSDVSCCLLSLLKTDEPPSQKPRISGRKCSSTVVSDGKWGA